MNTHNKSTRRFVLLLNSTRLSNEHREIMTYKFRQTVYGSFFVGSIAFCLGFYLKGRGFFTRIYSEIYNEVKAVMTILFGSTFISSIYMVIVGHNMLKTTNAIYFECLKNGVLTKHDFKALNDSPENLEDD